jgi:hypothetical protein
MSHITTRQQQLAGRRSTLKKRQVKVQTLEEKIRAATASPILGILKGQG